MKLKSFIFIFLCVGLVSCHKSAGNSNEVATVNTDSASSSVQKDSSLVQQAEESDPIKEVFEKSVENHTMKYIKKNKKIRKIIKRDEAGEMISAWWSEGCSSTKYGKSQDGKVYYVEEEYDCWSYTIYYDSENKQFYVKNVIPDDDRDVVKRYHVGGGDIPENIKSLMR